MQRCIAMSVDNVGGNKKLKKAVPLKGGRELFSEKKVRRGFLTHRTTITHTTRGKPLRLQKLSFLVDLASAKAVEDGGV